jgi:hydrogenase maturation protein HypF
MDVFKMCPACAAEYTDPKNRRFHAQPISCFDCGPTLRLQLADGMPQGDRPEVALWEDAIEQARVMLAAGRILAVKGIGGFTLFCDARNQQAVQLLRQRKRRPAKPFAVMVSDFATALGFAQLGEEQLAELASAAHPIMLAPHNDAYDLADGVAPGLDDVGVMLAYAPIHQLLVQPGEVYVATSANGSGEPLTYEDDDAVRLLGGIVDAFLTHDRAIYVPVEDSVVMGEGSNVLPIRRSRGYAPLPVRLGDEDVAVLAVGGELKNTFALTRDGMAFLSAHIGDMGSLECQQAFEKSVDQLLKMHRRAPELVVADLHPDYATTGWAERYAARAGIPLLQVQHHHAHALSLVAERHLLGEPLLCAVFDGTGYGLDETIWGGELLALGADPMDWQRVWHLPGLWLVGGDSAVGNPWKIAVALLAEYDISGTGLPPFQAAPVAELRLVQSQLASHTGTVRTTSAGRWFDAVSSLLGVTQRVSYEGQAAMELERAARLCDHPSHRVSNDLELSELVGSLVMGLRAGDPVPCLARRFHVELAGILIRALAQQLVQLGIEAVGWSGGVAANRLLSQALGDGVAKLGLQLHTHQVVPANDGGLSLGQALAGQLNLTKEA